MDKVYTNDIIDYYRKNPPPFESPEDIQRWIDVIEATTDIPETKEAKSGGKIKKNYGYMGGGKVYGQPRKATDKAG